MKRIYMTKNDFENLQKGDTWFKESGLGGIFCMKFTKRMPGNFAIFKCDNPGFKELEHGYNVTEAKKNLFRKRT